MCTLVLPHGTSYTFSSDEGSSNWNINCLSLSTDAGLTWNKALVFGLISSSHCPRHWIFCDRPTTLKVDKKTKMF